MAELEQSIKDPIMLSNIINARESVDYKRYTQTQDYDSSSDSDQDQSQEQSTNIDTLYKSMSKIIEQLNVDNLLLKRQVANLQEDLVTSKLTYAKNLDQLLRQLIDTRTMLVQMINSNKANIKAIVAEEVKSVAETIVNQKINKKFEEFAKEQRVVLSQHIRKSIVRGVTDEN